MLQSLQREPGSLKRVLRYERTVYSKRNAADFTNRAQRERVQVRRRRRGCPESAQRGCPNIWLHTPAAVLKQATM